MYSQPAFAKLLFTAETQTQEKKKQIPLFLRLRVSAGSLDLHPIDHTDPMSGIQISAGEFSDKCKHMV